VAEAVARLISVLALVPGSSAQFLSTRRPDDATPPRERAQTPGLDEGRRTNDHMVRCRIRPSLLVADGALPTSGELRCGWGGRLRRQRTPTDGTIVPGSAPIEVRQCSEACGRGEAAGMREDLGRIR
jgi:hypothetical protein